MDQLTVQEGKRPSDSTRRPTRNDVAALAGVSTAVVSYVMNDGPRKVAPATRQRVLDAVDELGYRPNDVARSLRMQSAHMVGLIGGSESSSDFGAITAGVSEAAGEESYLVAVSNVEDDQDQGLRAARRLIAKRVDGVVLAPGAAVAELVDVLIEGGVPFVVVGDVVPGQSSILVDHAAVDRVAVAYLTSLGHKRIGLLRRGQSEITTLDRPVGYEQGLADAGVAYDDQLVIEVADTVEDGVNAVGLLARVPNPPTALIAQSDLVALGALDALKRRGVLVPLEFSMVGADDLALGSHLSPQLTSVGRWGQPAGRSAFDILLRKINNDDVPVASEVEPVVVVRESTTIAPDSSPLS